jgi:hypothetical protein
MTAAHLLIWEALGRYGCEIAHVRFHGDGRMSAHGTQIAAGERPYQLEYRLQVGAGLVTERLEVEVRGSGWTRTLDLRRAAGGTWSCEGSGTGEPALPQPGGDMGALVDALDCDLAFSPLTNLMPVRREGLLDGGERDFTMAWVAVPSLQVLASHQTYRFLRRDEHGSVVHYVGRHRGFEGDLRFDREGFIRLYPGLGLRRHPAVPAARAERASRARSRAATPGDPPCRVVPRAGPARPRPRQAGRRRSPQWRPPHRAAA